MLIVRVIVLVQSLSPVPLCDPRSPPGCSVRGVSQARILEWVAISSPRDLPNPGIKPGVSCIAGRFFTI